MDINKIFFCKFCEHKSRTVIGHLHHFKVHRHLTSYIYCGLGHCYSSFRNETSLKTHIIRNHKIFINHRQRCSAPLPPNGTVQCTVPTCHQQFFDRASLMSHLKTHLTSGLSVPCPFRPSGCNKEYATWNSLTGHITRKHRNRNFVQPDTTGLVLQNIDPNLMIVENVGNVQDEVSETQDEVCETRDEFLIALAQFYQKLEYKHMVPSSVTQVVATEIKTLVSEMRRGFLGDLNSILQTEGLPTSQISDILAQVCQKDSVMDDCNILRSIYMRKKFYENHFCFVEPQVLPLKNGGTYYYVPIEKTIQAAFKNKSWNFCIKVQHPSEDGVLRDFYDGESFKQNTFFQENPLAIPIILYQDGVKLACPIGPNGNKKHKVEAIYLAFGNLPADIRFHKDSIQLVALCVKSDFSHKEIYEKIVGDILRLQERGTEIETVGNVKAGLAFIAGDNLGSHSLGGFVENFSKATYFCRYCLIPRPLFRKPGGEIRRFRTRTVESYVRAQEKAEVLPDGKIKSYQGVKFDSPFNSIKGFHVCAPALPPCLGHDLCEGVIAHDLKLYIQYFVSKKWFTLEELNKRILNFPYSIEDGKDKPPKIIDLKKKRLAGSAWQLYTLIRLFPLMVHDLVKDPNNRIWKLVLSLKEIAQFCVAPEVHMSYLPSFQITLHEYLILRVTAFPTVPIRPKHHYLNHYCECYFYFGSLMRVFTLRWESKHPFFKRSWKSSNNSINITQTLSYKHEFFQSWVRSGGGIRSEVETKDRTLFDKSLYSEAIQSVVTCGPLEECTSVTMKGTLYKKGNIVVLRKLGCFDDILQVGMIYLILIDPSDEVKFVVKLCLASLVPKYGDFKLTNLPSFECVKQKDLLSFYPLDSYIRDTKSFIVLRHALVNKEFDLSCI